jgi:hypothetical protein
VQVLLPYFHAAGSTLPFFKPNVSVILHYCACGFALPVAMVIAWHQGFRALRCIDAGKAKKRSRNDPLFVYPHFRQFQGSERKVCKKKGPYKIDHCQIRSGDTVLIVARCSICVSFML